GRWAAPPEEEPAGGGGGGFSGPPPLGGGAPGKRPRENKPRGPWRPPMALIRRQLLGLQASTQPKSGLSDVGRSEAPNSGKPEFGRREGAHRDRRTVGRAFMTSRNS